MKDFVCVQAQFLVPELGLGQRSGAKVHVQNLKLALCAIEEVRQVLPMRFVQSLQ